MGGDSGERGRAGEPDFAIVPGTWGPGPLAHECAAPDAGWSAPGESARRTRGGLARGGRLARTEHDARGGAS